MIEVSITLAPGAVSPDRRAPPPPEVVSVIPLKHFHDPLPDARLAPPVEAVVTGHVGTVGGRQTPPRRATPKHPQDAPAHLPVVPAPRLRTPPRKERLDQPPLPVSHVVAAKSRSRGRLDATSNPSPPPEDCSVLWLADPTGEGSTRNGPLGVQEGQGNTRQEGGILVGTLVGPLGKHLRTIRSEDDNHRGGPVPERRHRGARVQDANGACQRNAASSRMAAEGVGRDHGGAHEGNERGTRAAEREQRTRSPPRSGDSWAVS